MGHFLLVIAHGCEIFLTPAHITVNTAKALTISTTNFKKGPDMEKTTVYNYVYENAQDPKYKFKNSPNSQ